MRIEVKMRIALLGVAFGLWGLVIPSANAAPRQLFAVEWLEATDPAGGRRLVLLADRVLSAPASGNYLILDTEGVAGLARIRPKSVRGRDHTRPEPPLHVELEWVGAPAVRPPDFRHRVAVGPITGTLPKARLLRAGMARAGRPVSEPDEEANVRGPHGPATYAVDLDGDGRADLVAYYHREAGARERSRIAYEERAETWSRTSRGWRRVEFVRSQSQGIIGP